MKLPRNALIWCVLIVCITDTGKLRQQWLTNPAVSSNLEAGAGPPFQG